MDASMASLALSLLVIAMVAMGGRALNWVWFRPKRLEKCLREQGFSGRPYRILYGDMKENGEMLREAKASTISISDDIVPRVAPLLHRTVQTYGKNSFIWVGPVPRVIIMDPQQIKDVLMMIFEFQKPKTNPLSLLLVQGLFSYEEEKWAKHRRIINPAFHVEKLKGMVPVFHQSCGDMMSKWEKSASEEGSCELDVWPHLQELTSDIISRTAFGSNYEQGRRIFDLLKELIDYNVQVSESVYIPGWRFLPTKTNKRMKHINREIRISLQSIINNREKAMRAGKEQTDDLLGTLLSSNRAEIQERENDKRVGLSMDEVIAECKLFYLAGQETTAVLLVWTMVLLSKHRDWQTRAREEVMEVFGDNVPDFDGLNRLKMMTMIVNEVLRLYPPAVLINRATYRDVKIGNLVIPTGVEISLPTILVHHDCDFWGDDASEFNPERFSGGISKAATKQVSFFPFSWGPRICIGQNFALVEAKLALAMILQRFSFELAPSYTHAPYLILTLKPQHGALLTLRRL